MISSSSLVPAPTLSFHSPRLYIYIVVLICAVGFLALERVALDDYHSWKVDSRCDWQANDPVLYNLKTELKPYSFLIYDASHWFHMAESFMSQHSILRAKHNLANASEVFYNFDEANFATKLNPMTRLFIYLGTVDSKGKLPQQLTFLHFRIQSSLRSGERILLRDKQLSAGQVIKLSPSTPAIERFDVSSSLTSPSVSRRSVCLKYVDSIGGPNRPQRGRWFNNAGDVQSLRDNIRNACPANRTLVRAYAKKKLYKLLIYQRDKTRRFSHIDSMVAMLRGKLPHSEQWEIQMLTHSNSRSVCELVHLVHNVDVLVTPHGFQTMLLLFLPLPAIVFEVFPYRYFKNCYQKLSGDYGILYGDSMSPPTSWHSALFLPYLSAQDSAGRFQFTPYCPLCREYSRAHDVMLTVEGVDSLVDLINGSLFFEMESNLTRHANNNSDESSSYYIVHKHLTTKNHSGGSSSGSSSGSGNNKSSSSSSSSYSHQRNSKRGKSIRKKEDGAIYSRQHYSDILF